MKCRKAYGIMPVGENDRSAHVAQQKAPEVATPGLFYSVLGGWLNPKAGYQLFFSVQPFADVVGNYTCQNREKIFMVIWQFIVNAFQLLLKGGQWASQLGDKIPQPVVATIVHYLLLIVFVGGIAIGVGFLIFLGASKVFEFYTEDYADTMSLAVFLISLAVSVYFAEPIRAVIPINLLLLLILVHIVYVLIRWYVKGCMRSRGYY